MLRFVRFLAILPLLTTTISVATGEGQRPQFRPAVLMSGPDSLINRIDAQALMNAGQKDGAVMFSVVVSKTGEAKQSRTYRAMPGTEPLERELRQRLKNTRFTPAIYNHQPVAVILSGSLFFSIVDNKPRVHLFLNQDPDELKETSDFIAPQPVFGADSAFTGLDYPPELPVQVNAVVDLRLVLDADGTIREARVINEDPPLLGFGDLVAKDFKGVKFIPAFRDGDRTECNTVFAVAYQPADSEPPSVAAPLIESAGATVTPLQR